MILACSDARMAPTTPRWRATDHTISRSHHGVQAAASLVALLPFTSDSTSPSAGTGVGFSRPYRQERKKQVCRSGRCIKQGRVALTRPYHRTMQSPVKIG
jgi:hypothetical protein